MSTTFKLFLFSLFLAFTLNTNASDNIKPTLISITPDKTSVDVSISEQQVIFTIDATDDSGIDWASSFLYFRTTEKYCYRENIDGEIKCTFSSTDNDGTIYLTAFIYDKAGNALVENAATSITIVGGNVTPIVNGITADNETVDVTEGEKTINFSIDVTDASGINWDSSYIYFPYTASTGKYCSGTDEVPNTISCLFSSDDPEGELSYRVRIEDIHGSYFYQSSYGSITLIGGRERTPPVMDSISNDKIGIDISLEEQVVNYSLSASDSSGIDWEKSQIALKRGNDFSVYATGYGANSSPQSIGVSFSTDLESGIWRYAYIKIMDNLGNERLYGSSDLAQFGLADSVHVYKNSDPASNLEINAENISDQVTAGTNFTHSFKITNNSEDMTEDLQLKIESTNVLFSSIAYESLSSGCTSTVNNNRSSTSCSLSSLQGENTEEVNVTFSASQFSAANYSIEIASNEPDISFNDNRAVISMVVMPDGDSDGINDTLDNCASIANADQTNTDSDSLGDACDEDDDNDNVLDGDDAFPLDGTETIDTDGDGIGNNADTDDDNDGVADSDDAFPFDSAESNDSDGDGLGDNADAFPNDSSETVDSDSDGIGDNADVFPNDPTESADTDLDGVGDNADAFPNDTTEAVDSDSDGTGDNADAFPNNALYSVDSDSDGMPDEWETRYGLDPNDASDASSDQDNDGVSALDEFLAGTIPSGSLDIDGNEDYDALTDGLLLLRGMFGLDGSALVTGTIASDAAYTESVDIESRIATLGDLADIDGNGEIDALTDGLLTLRYLFGLQGDTLINGVVAGDATRKTAEEIEAHLETLMPAL